LSDEKIKKNSNSSKGCSCSSKGSRGINRKLIFSVIIFQALVRRLKETGLVDAYQKFLRSLCIEGLPEHSILYEKAAQYVLQYEKKMKKKI
jgi:hypothetical protein